MKKFAKGLFVLLFAVVLATFTISCASDNNASGDTQKKEKANKKAKYVMDAAMHMIHGMGLKIVSEGIETIEQYNRMKDLGISYIQGFYFSKPLDKDSFIRYIKENNKGAKNV